MVRKTLRLLITIQLDIGHSGSLHREETPGLVRWAPGEAPRRRWWCWRQVQKDEEEPVIQKGERKQEGVCQIEGIEYDCPLSPNVAIF